MITHIHLRPPLADISYLLEALLLKLISAIDWRAEYSG